jgi:hypothetical protein
MMNIYLWYDLIWFDKIHDTWCLIYDIWYDLIWYMIWFLIWYMICDMWYIWDLILYIIWISLILVFLSLVCQRFTRAFVRLVPGACGSLVEGTGEGRSERAMKMMGFDHEHCFSPIIRLVMVNKHLIIWLIIII